MRCVGRRFAGIGSGGECVVGSEPEGDRSLGSTRRNRHPHHPTFHSQRRTLGTLTQKSLPPRLHSRLPMFIPGISIPTLSVRNQTT